MTYEMTIGIGLDSCTRKPKATKRISVTAPDYSSAWEKAFCGLEKEFPPGEDFISVEDFRMVS